MTSPIDVERGVIYRKHRETEMGIYMYWDDPGYYYDEHGHPLSEEFARQAGFPVEEHAKERFRKEKLKAFNDEITKTMQAAEDMMDKEVLKERGEFQVLAMPYEQAIVVDGQGNKLTPKPIARTQAFGLLDHLAPEAPKVLKAKKEKAE
jgi:hypothetical protein